MMSRTMDEREQRVRLAMILAGAPTSMEVWRRIESREPGLTTQPTVWHYLFDPPQKQNVRILQAIAEALRLELADEVQG